MITYYRKLIAVCLLGMAVGVSGCKKAAISPHFEATATTLRMHTIGGPNHHLVCELDYRCDPGSGVIEITQTVDGETSVLLATTGAGEGAGHVPLNLMGSFVNNGDTKKVEDLLTSLAIDKTWSVDLSKNNNFTFLNYTGFQGQNVSYGVRLSERHEEGASGNRR